MKEVVYVSYENGRSVHSEGAVHSKERNAHRTKTAPCLLCVWTHSRGAQIVSSSRVLGIATDLSTDPWREFNQARAHAHLLPEMFHEGPEGSAAVPQDDRNASMSPRAGVTGLASAPFTLSDVSRRTAAGATQSRKQASAPSDTSCLRCGGLLVPSYTASLERGFIGAPETLWRCVNCGDCVDPEILANREARVLPARQRARPRTHVPIPLFLSLRQAV
jgi:hypothetical protein